MAASLVDGLPDTELATAGRLLEALGTAANSFRAALDAAPEDDEPYTDVERAAVAEALEDVRAGRLHTLDEVKKELGH